MNEVFKVIKEFPNYSVSNLGRVRNDLTGRILKPVVNKLGYLQMGLYKDKKYYNKRVNRLVAQTFLPNPNGYPQVNHKDEDKTNNTVGNLEWCTRKYNINYGTHNQRVFSKTTNGKLSKIVLQYDLYGNLIKEWPSTAEIQRQLGYANSNISACCGGKLKTVYGFVWKYKKD